MKILVTGGAGSVGSYLVAAMDKKGYYVRVLDKKIDNLQKQGLERVELIEGGVEDSGKVAESLKDIDVVIHLAWSFSDDPMELLNIDMKGHINLLEASLKSSIKHFIYTSSAVVYGKLQYSPIDENHPCNPETSRKPMYALAKLYSENLGKVFWTEKKLPFTNIRFWWAFSDEIGGRHLRNLAQSALQEETLELAEGSGGSFLHMDDFCKFIESAILNEKSFGETFNLGTTFITWKEVGEVLFELAQKEARIKIIPQNQWTGSAFMSDIWELSSEKASRVMGFQSIFSKEESRDLLKKAIGKTMASL